MKLSAAVVLLFAVPAFAQSFQVQMPAMPPRPGMPSDQGQRPARVEEEKGAGYTIRYETDRRGDTKVRVVEPEGGRVDVWDGTFSWHSEEIPTNFAAKSDQYYRFVIRFPDGRLFEKKLQTRHGMTMTLAVLEPNGGAPQPVATRPVPPAPPPPVQEAPKGCANSSPMRDADWRALKDSVAKESFSPGKLDLVKTAARSNCLTVDQVGQILDLFTFGEHKVRAVAAFKPALVDPKNGFRLYDRFTFAADKKKVRAILEELAPSRLDTGM